MNRNNRTRPRKASQGQKAAIRRLEHQMHGVAIRARNDPPPLVLIPWFNLTVRFTIADFSSTVQHTVTSIRSQLLSQLNIGSVSGYYIRIREVRAWGPGGGTFTMKINDPVNNSQLSQLMDTATPANRPHCGYIFPSRVASTSFGASSNVVAEYFTTAPVGSIEFEARYLIQFRFQEAASPASVIAD